MTTAKTVPTDVKVEDFLSTLDPTRQAESHRLIDMMSGVSKQPAVMWGSSIIGFGKMRYKYESGREGDWMEIGFSPRKAKLSLYITGDAEKYASQLDTMGKHSMGKGCIYINKLADVDLNKLRELIKQAYNDKNSS